MSGPESVDHTCNICLDTLGANGGVTTLLCGHPFCRTCLSRWQATSDLCPVCRTDQRTLQGNNTGEPSAASGPDDFEEIQAPSLASILDLMGQLLARERVHPEFPVEEGDPYRGSGQGSGVTFTWSSHPDATQRPHSPASPASGSDTDTSATAVSELQGTVQFIMARIESLERRPLYWNAQISELQQAASQLDACRHGTVPNPALVMQRVQQYTDSVNAQLDEFLTQEEAREQRRQQAEGRQRHSAANRSSAPPYASASPLQTGTPTDASSAPGSGTGSGGWSWKWGWGPAPAGTLPDDSSSSSAQTQQTSGIGVGAAAGAAAALATVGAAAAAAYRRTAGSTAQSASGASSAPSSSSASSAPQAQQQPAAQQSAHTGTAGSAQQSGRFTAAGGATVGPSGSASHSSRFTGHATGASAGPYASASSSAAGAGPPVQGIYDAVRGIFDRHVEPDSSLGRWGEVARHLNDLHGQMNVQDNQQQDVGRLLASAVNAYGAYRRATASPANP